MIEFRDSSLLLISLPSSCLTSERSSEKHILKLSKVSVVSLWEQLTGWYSRVRVLCGCVYVSLGEIHIRIPVGELVLTGVGNQTDIFTEVFTAGAAESACLGEREEEKDIKFQGKGSFGAGQG